MASLKLAVLASGRGSNLQAVLDATQDGRLASKVAVVISDVPGVAALDRARKAGVPAETIAPDAGLKREERRALHAQQIEKVLAHHGTDLVVLAGYMRIVPPVLVKKFRNRIVNVHPALLPAFPGLRAQQQALDAGVRMAGCTTHFVDEEVDHGPILLQAALPVRHDDTEDSLSRRILAAEHQLLPRTIGLVEEGRVKVEGRRVQVAAGPSWRGRVPALPDVLYPGEF